VKLETRIRRVKKAKSLNRLLTLLDEEWLEAVEGDYIAARVPTFGPETPEVSQQIQRSCDEGDIVSWDTRAKDSRRHRFLRRQYSPAMEIQNSFAIEAAQ
jgi:hypothetical protein